MSTEPVRLMHYDPRWRQEFEQTRSSILFSCDGWVTGVHHIGSTAISGLIARPTIDVIATVESDQAIGNATSLIEGLNFRSVDTPLWADGAQTLIKPRHLSAEDSDVTHRIFLVVHKASNLPSMMLGRCTLVRDYLIANPEVAIELEERKVSIWREQSGDFAAYQQTKADFFSSLQDRIDG
ncbi:dephospho-CoA kinase/protein folding accessory domain-containing protein [Rubripirellula amarantea]|uniref:Dephospho-CoA kinase/protein folding accessory domain-containing protein n=1 Tax=Rubripirellula amarantea TaxID=2527999 RepID=A0A5C5WSF1_9BACT|nr:GrpB family protein [Rubripirellula amarantea]TWT53438.1 dephospho-CoA kinase/protein folding accessory domain-containing protein [Rubripirellula amarantea]